MPPTLPLLFLLFLHLINPSAGHLYPHANLLPPSGTATRHYPYLAGLSCVPSDTRPSRHLVCTHAPQTPLWARLTLRPHHARAKPCPTSPGNTCVTFVLDYAVSAVAAVGVLVGSALYGALGLAVGALLPSSSSPPRKARAARAARAWEAHYGSMEKEEEGVESLGGLAGFGAYARYVEHSASAGSLHFSSEGGGSEGGSLWRGDAFTGVWGEEEVEAVVEEAVVEEAPVVTEGDEMVLELFV